MSASVIRRLGMVSAALATGAAALSLSTGADAITRDEVMVVAREQAFHPWRLTSANLSAPCTSGYQCVFQSTGAGDYMGVAYDWGGWKSTFQFDQDILAGEAAGSYNNYNGWPDDILSCTTGTDCSGLVTQAWGYFEKLGTWTLIDVASEIAQGSALPGDVFDQPGYHVVMFSHELPTGEPVYYEATPPWTVWSKVASWSYLSQYTPYRYNSITGTDAGNPEGTPTNPIVVPALPGAPYTDARSTAASPSSALDGCNAAPGSDQSGPEVVYRITVTQPGMLRATVGGDVTGSVDNDIHLYESMNTTDCVARDNTELLHPVDCGTYWVVVDTFGADAGNSGAYNLEIELQNPTGACGSGPPSYDFIGNIGSTCWCNGACSFCNPTVTSGTCTITEGTLTNGTGICTKQCVSHDECMKAPGATTPDVCCGAIDQSGTTYCVEGDACTGAGGSGTGGGGVGNSGTGGGAGVYTFGSPEDRDNGDMVVCSAAVNAPGSSRSTGAWLALLLAFGPAVAFGRRARRSRRAA